jgi:nucleotide-binding universal stress UspA family protein
MEHEHGRIVVGVDGSSDSRAALAYALRDAVRRRAAIEVVASFAPPDYWVPLYGAPAISFEEIRKGVLKDAESIVREVTEQTKGELTQLPPITVTAVPGGAAQALLQAAEDADLLVVGSRGHGGFTSVLLGSVSLACALHSTCPVTVVHSTKQAAAEQPTTAKPVPAGT